MHIELFREACLSYPFVEECLPFGPDTLVFKVKGKMFALISLDDIPYRVNLKCEPDRAIYLREQYPEAIFPGYHMNKQHWNTIIPEHPSLNLSQIQEFIQASYQLIWNKLPKKVREGSE